jgi:predicted porin
MKKTLLALAVLAASGAAFAQSSVTLFGVVDATFAYGKGDGASTTQLTNSGLNSSRLGFKGTEDLGGGLNASFWLEAGLNNDNGTGAATNVNNQAVGAFNTTTGANAPVRAGTQGLTFNRRSTVSVGGGFGEVRLGRDYTPQFWNLTVYDPFGTNGVGTAQILNSSLGGVTTVRASNTIGYFLPGNLGGFTGQLQYAMGENASTGTKDGNGIGLRAGYAAGPISAHLAYSKTKFTAGDITTTNLGGSYDFGAAKISAMYDQDKNGTVTGKGYLVGVNAPIGAGEIRASYGSYKTDASGTPKTDKFALGYVHNLSKRTAVYSTFAMVKNSGGATQSLNGGALGTGTKSTGFDLGVKHSF